MSVKYYVLDIETTGLNVNKHETTQISVVRHPDRMQLSKYIKALRPWDADPYALKLTNRTVESLEQGLDQEEAVLKFNNFFNQDGAEPDARCIIGHNVSFDRRFCQYLWKSYDQSFPAHLWLDTRYCTGAYAKKILGIPKPKLTLESAMNIMGIKAEGIAHNAVADTQNTYKLFYKLQQANFDFLPMIRQNTGEETDD